MEVSITSPPAPAGDWRAESRLMWQQSLPNIGLNVTRMMMTFIDFVMVAALGKAAIAAISPATLFVLILVAVGMAITNTVTTFASQAFGRGELREASAYAWQSIYVGAATMIACYPLMLCVEPIFRWFGHEPEVFRMEVEYCRICIWSMGPAVAATGLNSFFVGIQRPRVGLISVMAALCVNALGNYLLIYGKFGFPALGIAGAAIATVIGWCVRMGLLLCIFLREPLATKFETRRTWRISGPRLWNLLRVGSPTSVQWILDIAAWFLFQTILIAGFGTSALAAANVVIQCMHVSFMPAIGIGMTICSLVGHAIGEGRPALAVRRTAIGCAMISLYMGPVGVAFVVFREFLIGLFSSDVVVIEVGALMLIWAGVFQLFDGIGIAYCMALRGAGDTAYPAAAIFVLAWAVFLGGGWAATRWLPAWGFHGPWAACTVYVVLFGLVMWWRFRGGRWRGIKIA
ncbi:MAG: MATE family efflux transporter [Phycisphaerae bacterium]|nr:MATE family efflux transporter [Phycisphaerae bacterium]NUQ45056.1 MATE family efflux transporter [Phycisphaerae bacterium]